MDIIDAVNIINDDDDDDDSDYKYGQYFIDFTIINRYACLVDWSMNKEKNQMNNVILSHFNLFENKFSIFIIIIIILLI